MLTDNARQTHLIKQIAALATASLSTTCLSTYTGGCGAGINSRFKQVSHKQPHPDKVDKLSKRRAEILASPVKRRPCSRRRCRPVQSQRSAWGIMLSPERKRRLEVARVAALLLLFLHRLLLAVSARQQHMRRCPVRVLNPFTSESSLPSR